MYDYFSKNAFSPGESLVLVHLTFLCYLHHRKLSIRLNMYMASLQSTVFYTHLRSPLSHTHTHTHTHIHIHTHTHTHTVSPVKEDQLYGYLWKEEGDDLWCRALVGGISGSEANVMFPDYGNSDTVEIDNLKELPGTYYEIPFQVCCVV